MSFVKLTHVGSRNKVIDNNEYRTNPLVSACRRCGLLPNCFRHLLLSRLIASTPCSTSSGRENTRNIERLSYKLLTRRFCCVIMKGNTKPLTFRCISKTTEKFRQIAVIKSKLHADYGCANVVSFRRLTKYFD